MTDINRRKTLALGLGAASALLFRPPVFAVQDGKAAPPPPPELLNTGIADRRAHFADISARSPIRGDARAAFLAGKLRAARSHPLLDQEGRRKAAQDILRAAGPAAAGLVDQPVPGGVGYGVFYTDAFKTAWGQGTALLYDIVCPQPPGGNVDNFLYLTATNRSALGVEAFVLYYAQNQPYFTVFDWSQAATNPWQTSIAFSDLQDYLAPDANSEQAPQLLTLWNATFSLGDGRYRNQALLYNRQRKGWDLIYEYDYPASEDDQKSGWVGSWGPIVETFQASYSGTKPMGAVRTFLCSADRDGQWGKWSQLKPEQSYVRTDSQGFQLRFIAPNFSYVVIS